MKKQTDNTITFIYIAIIIIVVLLTSCGSDAKRINHLRKLYPSSTISQENDSYVITFPTGTKMRASFEPFSDTTISTIRKY